MTPGLVSQAMGYLELLEPGGRQRPGLKPRFHQHLLVTMASHSPCLGLSHLFYTGREWTRVSSKRYL